MFLEIIYQGVEAKALDIEQNVEYKVLWLERRLGNDHRQGVKNNK